MAAGIEVERFILSVVAPKNTGPGDALRVRASLGSMFKAAEEDLTDLLPKGWRIVIEREESG